MYMSAYQFQGKTQTCYLPLMDMQQLSHLIELSLMLPYCSLLLFDGFDKDGC